MEGVLWEIEYFLPSVITKITIELGERSYV